MNKAIVGMVIATVSLVLLQMNMIALGLIGFIVGIAIMYGWRWPRK